MSIDEAIAHAKEVAKEKYKEGFLCHANPNDDKLDGCIECAKEHEQFAEWLTELKEYKQLEEQGLLLKLPCKAGDKIWAFEEWSMGELTGETVDFIVETIKIAFDSKRNPYFLINNMNFSLDCLGKTLFVTQVEAEEALKKMKSGE